MDSKATVAVTMTPIVNLNTNFSILLTKEIPFEYKTNPNPKMNISVFPDCDQNGPLGMITGEIQDWQITASSTYPQEWDKGCHERHGRVYQPNGLGWCAKYKSSSEWLQVDLGVAAKVGTLGT